MTKKILMVFGTRPEAIKMAPLYYAFKEFSDNFIVKICVTAQHRELLDLVLDIFDIIPDIDLDLMKKDQDLFDITSMVLVGMKKVISDEKPDFILVHGDTTTSMATALAGFYLGISVVHIEAGLRTYDLKSPFPEEFNRQTTSKLSRIHFAPTIQARDNLITEGINNSLIYVTGNTVIDSLLLILNRLESNPVRLNNVVNKIKNVINFDCTTNKFILITGHRRENFGDGFLQIVSALRELSLRYKNIKFIYPVHLNPNVQDPVFSALSNLNNFYLLPPLEYESFLFLLKYCYLVITDSGGLQEEAPALGKPVVLMRDTTERPEALLAGTVWMVGANKEKIINSVSLLIDDEITYNKMSMAHNPYGNGTASALIVSALRIISNE